MVRIFFLTLFLLAGGHAAAAQSITLSPTVPKQWDFALNFGWLGGNRSDIAEEWDNWSDSFATSIDAGRYWTPHLKSEVSATVTTDGSIYSQEQLIFPGQLSPLFFAREHHFSLTSVRLSAVYQLFENTWVHPFVAGGVQLGWERHRIETPFPFVFGRDPQTQIPAPLVDGSPRTTFDAHPFVGAGAKFYVGERGFIRTDLSAAFDNHGATHVTWRTGVGVDF